MKKTRYFRATVQEGNRLEISTPTLPVGQTVEVVLIIPDSEPNNPNVIDRQAFMRLPIEERQRILMEQAETLKGYYQEDTQWPEWVDLDIGDIDNYEAKTR